MSHRVACTLLIFKIEKKNFFSSNFPRINAYMWVKPSLKAGESVTSAH